MIILSVICVLLASSCSSPSHDPDYPSVLHPPSPRNYSSLLPFCALDLSILVSQCCVVDYCV